VPRAILRIVRSGQTEANASAVSIPLSGLDRNSDIEIPVFQSDDAASSPGPSRSGCLNCDLVFGKYFLGASATMPAAIIPRGPSPNARQMYALSPTRISSHHGERWSYRSRTVFSRHDRHRHHRLGRGGAGQAHRRWKMCDGWPAGPAPSKFYSTPIGTDPDPYPHCWCPSPPATRRRLRRLPRKGEGD
jgi:hypothetical protein